ncbi:MAG: efflux RND transporter periplasmic adaptor subunit [Candidatus Sulfotelmatobacter sp.]|jgi:RND family efflux transporter MFP subunit
MTEETKSRTTLEAQRSNDGSDDNRSNHVRSDGNHQQSEEPEQRHGLSEQAKRDEEIEEIQKRSKHQPVTVQSAPEQPPASPRKALMVVAILLVILLLAGGITMLTRLNHDRVLAKETERETVPTVAVVKPLAEKPDEDLILPGSLLAYEESPIYARTSGYLVKWYKDIGSRVTQGELLAKIDTPEVDQELNQARATRQQVVAQLDLAKISADRWEALRKTDSVSAQEADQETSGYKQAQANLAAADANVRRLEQLEGFKEVYAPFNGVLTRRNVDPGALINAGAGAAGRELFDLARVDPLRVYTSVPQAYAPYIKVGAKTTVTLQEFPGEKFVAMVARTAESIDTNTRTLLTEVDVPNKNGRLLPGSFGEVHFAVGNNVNKVTVPVNTMLFRAQGPQVAVVGSDNKIQLRAINIGRDYGTTLEILGGVSPTDQIVVNPPDSLEDGQPVNVAQAPPNQPQPAPSSQVQPQGQNNQQKGSAQ